MVQTVFLLEKMLLERGKAAKMAFTERFVEQSFTLALQAYVGPSGPWTLQGVHTQTPLLWCEAGRGALEPGSRVPLRMEP